MSLKLHLSKSVILSSVAAMFVLVPASPLSIITNANATAEKSTDRLIQHTADARAVTQENGIYTIISITAGDGKSGSAQEGLSKFSAASIIIERFTFEIDDFGVEHKVDLLQFHFNDRIPEDAFQATNSLETATLSAELTGLDDVSGTEKTINVNVDWTG